MGDNYYCADWEKDILSKRVLHKGFYIMDDINHFYSLMYHGLCQKAPGRLSNTYKTKFLDFEPKTNVGINESNPSEMLHIKDDGNSDIFGGLIIKSNNNTVHTKYGWRGVDGSDSLRFGTGDTERMRIDSSGHFFFSTTSQGVAGGHFNIDGSGSGRNAFSVKGTTGNYVMVSDAGGSTGDHINFRNYTGGDNETGRIKDDGSNVTYHTTSDYRLKENVVAISDGISRVKQLNPIRHTGIGNSAPGTIDGWLAHELDEVCPYAVDGEKDATNPDGSINPQGVDYGRITPLLTAALKEAIAKIEKLETEVAALKAA